MITIQPKCIHCQAKSHLMATTRLADGRKRRRFWCDEGHRFSLEEDKPSPPQKRPARQAPTPPAIWSGAILTEWRVYPSGYRTSEAAALHLPHN